LLFVVCSYRAHSGCCLLYVHTVHIPVAVCCMFIPCTVRLLFVVCSYRAQSGCCLLYVHTVHIPVAVCCMFIPCTFRLLFTPHRTHTPNQGNSIKWIEIIYHFPYNVIFLLYFIVFYYILYLLQNYICGHIYHDFIITRYYIVLYHNNTLLYCIVS